MLTLATKTLTWKCHKFNLNKICSSRKHTKRHTMTRVNWTNYKNEQLEIDNKT